MDWVPTTFIAFKVLVLGIGMFFAVKWHYEQGKKGTRAAVLRASGKVAAVFVLSLLALLLVTFAASGILGLDLTLP